MFGYGIDKRVLYIIFGIMIVMGLFGMTQNALLGLLLSLPGVLLAITFHEFAHAYAADKLGDDTPRMQGRLSLNPLAHLDPVGSLLLVFAHVGWGKPVQINPRNFNKNISLSAGEAIVSVAGPAMNVILAIILAIITYALAAFAPTFILSQVGYIIFIILQSAVVVNIGLGIFNLIPLPPLDGSKIFMNFMPYKARTWIIEHEQIFYIVFLVIWLTPLASIIISPVIDGIYNGIMWVVSAIFGLFI